MIQTAKTGGLDMPADFSFDKQVTFQASPLNNKECGVCPCRQERHCCAYRIALAEKHEWNSGLNLDAYTYFRCDQCQKDGEQFAKDGKRRWWERYGKSFTKPE